MYLLVIKQLVTMTLIVVAGFAFAKIVKVTEQEQKFLSKLLLYFINPCLVFTSFDLDFESEKLLQLAFTIFVSVLIHGVMILTATLATLKKKTDKDFGTKILDRVGIVFTNCGFIGIPLIRGVFGDGGVFFLMGYLVTFNVLLWTYGYFQMCGSINIKKIITNPNIIAVCLGLILFCLPVRLPQLVGVPLKMIGDLNTAVSMILLGILLSAFKADRRYVARLIKFSLFRLVICSLLNLAVLFVIYKIFAFIPDSRMILFVVLICSICPSATSVPSLACVFEKDTSYASLIVSVTSILCLVTVPSVVALAEQILK